MFDFDKRDSGWANRFSNLFSKSAKEDELRQSDPDSEVEYAKRSEWLTKTKTILLDKKTHSESNKAEEEEIRNREIKSRLRSVKNMRESAKNVSKQPRRGRQEFRSDDERRKSRSDLGENETSPSYEKDRNRRAL